MPRRYTSIELVTRCKRRADKENDRHITTAEWKALMSEVYGELWGEISACIERYFETTETVTADGSASYDEPDDHLSTIRIARVDSSGREFPLRELRSQDEASFVGLTVNDAVGYTHVDNQLFLYPSPSSGTYRWYYLPQPPDLSSYADDDLVDVMTADGEAFLIWGVAAIALAKSESNSSLALAKQEAARERVQYWAANRNLADSSSRPVDDGDIDRRFGPDGWERCP